MDTHTYFSSPIYREEKPEWVEETLVRSEKYYAEATTEVGVCPVVQTGHMARDMGLSYLTSYFKNKGVDILKDQGYTTEGYEFYVSDMWGQELSCTGSNIMHVHGDSQISGFYFLVTPEGGSYPIFDDPRPSKKMSDLSSTHGEEITMATRQIHFGNVRAGTLMLFNSWLPHMITPNQSSGKTKFIHFILSQRRRYI